MPSIFFDGLEEYARGSEYFETLHTAGILNTIIHHLIYHALFVIHQFSSYMQGDIGITGPVGPQGIKGERGDDGLNGMTGAPGMDGANVSIFFLSFS